MFISTHGDTGPKRARPVPPPVDATVTYPDEGGVRRLGKVRHIRGDQAVIAPQDVLSGALSARTHTAAWALCHVVAPEVERGPAR